MTATTISHRPWLTVLLLSLGIAGCAALWVLVSMATGRVSSWMSVVAALDAALLLRMAQVRPGAGRAFWGVVATVACIALSLWVVVAGLLGRMLGLTPWEAATRMGSYHAWTLVQTTHGAADAAWLVAGVVIAAVLSR
ncbi:MAG: hypothetical protein GX761_10510 [Gammaproteobacteria bacterium]|uniref:hypothetical protein n=1 Tax=Luteimonas sp. JM171 TaxID=1896164 RepID=UPI0008552BDF|nr:hypothetical protein [Luteimonas sp. JM171]AOH35123.1 hypothetical protein BGP89_01060 [Luteimonas sp. JM171]NLC61695.1 hypothetical protein [Gammaproteobacteria bacterium]